MCQPWRTLAKLPASSGVTVPGTTHRQHYSMHSIVVPVGQGHLPPDSSWLLPLCGPRMVVPACRSCCCPAGGTLRTKPINEPINQTLHFQNIHIVSPFSSFIYHQH